jgi:hypothetical protein
MSEIDDNAEASPQERQMGPQPLDALMLQWGLNNHSLVAASAHPLTHKAVQRARRGRRVTRRLQLRLLEAYNRALGAAGLADQGARPAQRLADLFTY